MANYKFDWLNGNTEIINPVVRWTNAGFDRDLPSVTLDISLITPTANFLVQLSTNKVATDRSDEAIDDLMLLLLEPYEQ